MPALAYEIEEFEVPSQKYTFLKACLKFLQPIISQQLKTNIDTRTLGYCVVFSRESCAAENTNESIQINTRKGMCINNH